MSLASFYSNPDLEDGFGATAGRKRPHRGLDFAKREGTPIPAWRAGIVVVSEYHSGLGWVVETDSGSIFPGYCHMLTRGLPVGSRVALGDIVGLSGNTGSESLGPHLHTTAGTRPGAVFGATMSSLQDPWPYIKDALEPNKPRRRRRGTVSLFHKTENGKTTFALAGESPGTTANWLETEDQTFANQLAGQHGNSAQLSVGSWNAWKARYLEPVKVKDQ